MFLLAALISQALAAPTCTGAECLECLPGQAWNGDHARLLLQRMPEASDATLPSGERRVGTDSLALIGGETIRAVSLSAANNVDVVRALQIPDAWVPGTAAGSWTPQRSKGKLKHQATATSTRALMGRDVQVRVTWVRADDKAWSLQTVQLQADEPSAQCTGLQAPWRSPSAHAAAWASRSNEVQEALKDGWTLHTTMRSQPHQARTSAVHVAGHDSVMIISEGVSPHTVHLSRPELHSEAAVRLQHPAGTSSVTAYGRVLIERVDVRLSSGDYGAVAAVLVRDGSQPHTVVLDDLMAPEETDEQRAVETRRAARLHTIEAVQRAIQTAHETLRAQAYYDVTWSIVAFGNSFRELDTSTWRLSAQIAQTGRQARDMGCDDLAADLAKQKLTSDRLAAVLDHMDVVMDDIATGRAGVEGPAVEIQVRRLRSVLPELDKAVSDFAAAPVDTCATDAVQRAP